jgi:membrane fusion protein, multidrug efflux system
MRALKKFLLGSAAVVAVAAVAFVGIKFIEGSHGGAAGAQGAMPAMPVPVAAVVKRTIPIYLEYSARTESIRSVPLQPKVSGYIQSQATPDGADVKEHDLLYKIDERDYRAALDQAKAQAQRDVAAVDYARSNYGRGDELTKSGFLSKDSFDQRVSALRQSEAAVAADNAAIRSAENNLEYTEIRAPFAGRLGRNNAPIGTLVGAGGGALNTLVQLDPIYVTFNPSEGDLVQIENARRTGKAKAQVTLPGGGGTDHFGELTFVDNSVDRTTGTIAARATIANQDFTLLPGQYVRIRVHVRDQADALMVPQVAIGSSQLGKYVYVVGADSKAEQKLVTTGPVEGNLVTVTGIAEADQVIVGNLQKIGPGAPVQPLAQKQAAADGK